MLESPMNLWPAELVELAEVVVVDVVVNAAGTGGARGLVPDRRCRGDVRAQGPQVVSADDPEAIAAGLAVGLGLFDILTLSISSPSQTEA